MNTDTRAKGRAAEEAACRYLEQNGYTVVMRNYYTPFGEIDIVAESDLNVVFVEVKSRRAVVGRSAYGRPAAAVNYEKRSRIAAAAGRYIREYRPNKRVRFDVIEIYTSGGGLPSEINHITGAFTDERKY